MASSIAGVTSIVVYKLITILAAAIPIILFLKAVFFGRSKAMKMAISDFRQRIDYLVWMILFVIGCGIIYALGKLAYSFWN